MKTMFLKAFSERDVEIARVVLLFVILLLMWPMVQQQLLRFDVTVGYVDPGILILVVISLICFLGLIGLCCWLFNRFLLVFGLPGFGTLVLRFNELELWFQLGFYFGVYALLLLAGTGCFVAVL
jgi:multisubunit Na+/H+ antiporter MnhE subunit